MWYTGKNVQSGSSDNNEAINIMELLIFMIRFQLGSNPPIGVVLDGLPSYRSSHHSVEDTLREALHMLEILPPDERQEFMRSFNKYYQTRSQPPFCLNKVEQPRKNLILSFSNISCCPTDQALRHELLDKVVILKLNGFVGTNMGCKWPKSAIEVRSELSFLDLTVRQVEYLNSMYGVDVPLVLMNSFKTHETTAKIIRKYRMHNLTIHTFMQSSYPRIVKDTLQPLPTGPFTEETNNEWYPPGHGDVFHTLYTSGLLENLINQGKEYIFISNIENLCATINLNLLYHIVDTEVELLVELVESSRADNSGGIFVEYEGKPKIIETTVVPKEKLDEFRRRFTLFNTNNIWGNLRTIQKLVAQNEMILDIDSYEKVVSGTRTIQMRSSAGDALTCFFQHNHSVATCVVPRSRYLPVKSTSDLFLVQSNLYSIKHGSLIMSPERGDSNTPLIKLGQEFSHVEEFLRRVPHGVPNILELDHLTVAGDVAFGSNVTLQGTVIIVANEGSMIMIPDGTVLKNKVVTGNLRLLDH